MRPGGVRNSNAHTVPALARRAGARRSPRSSVAQTTRTPTRAAIERALDADVAVVCGGVSVGEHDHVKAALRGAWRRRGASGAWRFGPAGRPGSASAATGRGPGRARLRAPGNPVSAFVTFVLFARPALGALSGTSDDLDAATAHAALPAVPRLPRRDQAVRCALELGDEGWVATPTGPQGSHVLTSMLGADALAIVEAGPGAAKAGTPTSKSSAARLTPTTLPPCEVEVRLFAVLRERAGADSVELELPEPGHGRRRDRGSWRPAA